MNINDIVIADDNSIDNKSDTSESDTSLEEEKRSRSFLEIRPDDMVYQYYKGSKVIWKYDPKHDGWCVYVAIAQAMLNIPYTLADLLGSYTKTVMLRTLEYYKIPFEQFYGQADYNAFCAVLRAPPDKSTQGWWFVTPDMFWIAVVAFNQPILYGGHGHRKGVTLYHPPKKSLLPDRTSLCPPPSLLLQRHYHILLYRLEQYKYNVQHKAKQQDHLNACFYNFVSK